MPSEQDGAAPRAAPQPTALPTQLQNHRGSRSRRCGQRGARRAPNRRPPSRARRSTCRRARRSTRTCAARPAAARTRSSAPTRSTPMVTKCSEWGAAALVHCLGMDRAVGCGLVCDRRVLLMRVPLPCQPPVPYQAHSVVALPHAGSTSPMPRSPRCPAISTTTGRWGRQRSARPRVGHPATLGSSARWRRRLRRGRTTPLQSASPRSPPRRRHRQQQERSRRSSSSCQGLSRWGW